MQKVHIFSHTLYYLIVRLQPIGLA